ncbi:Hypothetical protein HPV225_0226 [Helicobacter pylori v225d]|nr:Hypothetical protein HPV225_0226 [Helicobacter pylori v225d]
MKAQTPRINLLIIIRFLSHPFIAVFRLALEGFKQVYSNP